MIYPFKVGDDVRLNGGMAGPRMKVTKIEKDATGVLIVCCSWFAGTEHKSASFPADALKIAERPSGSGLATGVDFDF